LPLLCFQTLSVCFPQRIEEPSVMLM
jgi:hypothetical protein